MVNQNPHISDEYRVTIKWEPFNQFYYNLFTILFENLENKHVLHENRFF